MTGWLLERFGRLKVSGKRAREVLSMNQRNLWYVYPNNPRRHFPLADDKLKTKGLMEKAGVRVPKTYRVYRNFYELGRLAQDLAPHREFVIKPSQGRGGGGILVVAGREDDQWLGVSGRPYRLEEVRKHLADIIFGVYSFDLSDAAMVEERVVQDPRVEELSPLGLADVRLILLHDRPVLTMMRLPTSQSQGRANLHQGGVGVGIDLETGRTNHAIAGGAPISHHPDSGIPLVGRQIPFWGEVVAMSIGAAKALPLKYLGVDIAISPLGPVLLEVNVRPGLEIQNANLLGLRPILEGLEEGR